MGGSNGAGKTTLLNLISRRLTEDRGQITWEGGELDAWDIAYLQSEPQFYPLITGHEFLQLYSYRNPDFDVNRWNELFQLLLDDLIETYSTGMKKKLALIGIIALDRPVLLLDEPFNNLDIETNQIICNLFGVLAQQQKLVILTSHILETLVSMCDAIHTMERGTIKETVAKNQFRDCQQRYRKHERQEDQHKIQHLMNKSK